MFRPGSPRSTGRWAAAGRFAKTTSSCRRKWSKRCATAPIGASCCRRQIGRRSRRRGCRPPPMSAPRSGRRNGEDDMKRSSTPARTALAALVAALAVIAGFSVARFWTAQAQLPAPSASTPVPVVLPKLQSVTDYFEITGNAAAVNDVKLLARVSGYLEAIHYQDGQFVKKGDLLFTIQKEPYKQQLEQAHAQVLTAQAALVHAKTELVRYTKLVKQ